MKRTPLRRITPLRRGDPLGRRNPLKKRVSKRAEPDRPMADWCEARIQVSCTGRAGHRHHKLRRSQGGTDDSTNTVDLCWSCHEFIHANPAWSYEQGYLMRRTA